MEKMVEPDRTIMIVSIVGLVIIWGSVAYHKFLQGSSGGGSAETGPGVQAVADTGDSGTSASGGRHGEGQQAGGQGKKGRKSAGKKRLRRLTTPAMVDYGD
ncbi:uncharacterized protein METZ01_LOCUS413448 [marine metagenome]|uniref:Uncharacterized protein n=1 Tax=marine metagenome TaxID=408172 RepID=A0A382WPW8_9ZZZZ